MSVAMVSRVRAIWAFCKETSSWLSGRMEDYTCPRAPIRGYNRCLMLTKDLLRKEINTHLSNRLGLTLTVGLALGLALSLGVIYLFAEITEEVVEGESRRFDILTLLWIDTY